MVGVAVGVAVGVGVAVVVVVGVAVAVAVAVAVGVAVGMTVAKWVNVYQLAEAELARTRAEVERLRGLLAELRDCDLFAHPCRIHPPSDTPPGLPESYCLGHHWDHPCIVPRVLDALDQTGPTTQRNTTIKETT